MSENPRVFPGIVFLKLSRRITRGHGARTLGDAGDSVRVRQTLA